VCVCVCVCVRACVSVCLCLCLCVFLYCLSVFLYCLKMRGLRQLRAAGRKYARRAGQHTEPLALLEAKTSCALSLEDMSGELIWSTIASW
jgi:hypothetical protein